MSSPQPADALGAQDRFRQAFERLKSGQPKVLPVGTAVTQNNVAREASCDPSALKKARFPLLVSEIQAYIELHNGEDTASVKKAARLKARKRSTEERLADALVQRDMAQSTLASANLRILELVTKVDALQRTVDELQPPPTKLGRR